MLKLPLSLFTEMVPKQGSFCTSQKQSESHGFENYEGGAKSCLGPHNKDPHVTHLLVADTVALEAAQISWEEWPQGKQAWLLSHHGIPDHKSAMKKITDSCVNRR